MVMQRRPTAIIYARVSSAKQAQDELPIESQIEVNMQRAQALGAAVLKVFKDEGLSGRTARRAAFQNAIAFCEHNEVDYFITWHSDRFARDHIDDGTFRKRLKKLGTIVVEVADGVDPNSQDAWFYVGLRALINEKRSADIGRDTKRSMMKNARDGFFTGGRLPFGYTAVQEGKRRRMVVVQHEAVIVRRIFADYIDGAGCKTIATQLNAEGVSKRGELWSKANVGLLLKNHRYIGLTIFNRMNNADRTEHPESEWVQTQSHEAIIDEDQFMKAQDLLAKRAPAEGNSSPKSQSVFTGMLRCSECNGLMQTETATGRTKRYKYYNCSTFLKKGTCRSRRINADEFDAWLCEELLNRLLTREQIASICARVVTAAASWTTKRAEDRARIVAEMRTIEERQSRLFDVLEMSGKAVNDLGEITNRLADHKRRREQLQSQLAEIDTNREVKPRSFSLDEAHAWLKGMVLDSCATEKRAFFATFVREVRISKDGTIVDYHPDKIVNQLGVQLVHGKESWLPDLGSNQGPAD